MDEELKKELILVRKNIVMASSRDIDLNEALMLRDNLLKLHKRIDLCYDVIPIDIQEKMKHYSTKINSYIKSIQVTESSLPKRTSNSTFYMDLIKKVENMSRQLQLISIKYQNSMNSASSYNSVTSSFDELLPEDTDSQKVGFIPILEEKVETTKLKDYKSEISETNKDLKFTDNDLEQCSIVLKAPLQKDDLKVDSNTNLLTTMDNGNVILEKNSHLDEFCKPVKDILSESPKDFEYSTIVKDSIKSKVKNCPSLKVTPNIDEQDIWCQDVSKKYLYSSSNEFLLERVKKKVSELFQVKLFLTNLKIFIIIQYFVIKSLINLHLYFSSKDFLLGRVKMKLFSNSYIIVVRANLSNDSTNLRSIPDQQMTSHLSQVKLFSYVIFVVFMIFKKLSLFVGINLKFKIWNLKLFNLIFKMSVDLKEFLVLYLFYDDLHYIYFHQKDFNPIWIPSDSNLASAIIKEYHEQRLHRGARDTITAIREKYYIRNLTRKVKSFINKCLICQKERKRIIQQPFANLPKSRTVLKPFESIAVDIFGPYFYQNGRKYYGLLATCLSSRMVKLEVLNSLDTNITMNALHSIFCVVGMPSKIFSDNGTNFIKSRKDILELYINLEKENKNSTSSFEWILSPPIAPWYNGCVERLVQVAKRCLKIYNNAFKSQNEARLAFLQAEAVINSRPLFMDKDRWVSPFELVFGRTHTQLPLSSSVTQHPKRLSNILNSSRKRLEKLWKSQYLLSLIPNYSQKIKVTVLNPGQWVMIPTEFKKRLDWPIAKIMDVIPSNDGVVRQVKLSLDGKILIRPANGLVLLPSGGECHET